MPAKTKKPPHTLESVRRQLADAEAAVGSLRAKLAKMAAHAAGEAEPVCGLDLLWDAALPMSRQRSSKHRCRIAWQRLPAACRPTVAVAISALKAWNRCTQWYLDDHAYAPGLHRFIGERMWEALPEESKTPAPMHRNMSSIKPIPPRDAGESVTDPSEISRLLGIAPKPAPLPKKLERVHGPEQIADMLKLITAADGDLP